MMLSNDIQPLKLDDIDFVKDTTDSEDQEEDNQGLLHPLLTYWELDGCSY